MRVNIGLKIKKLRENQKISEEELAYQLGISQTKLSNIENGTTKKVGVKLLNKICTFFGVDFYYFLDKKQVATANKNNGGLCEEGTDISDNFTNNILSQVKLLIEENRNKTQRIIELENELRCYKNK